MTTPRAVMDAVNIRAPLAAHARAALDIILVVLTVAAVVWVLYLLRRVLFVLTLGMFFAHVLAPLVRFAEHPVRIAGRVHALSRGLAIGLVYVLILGGAGAGSAILMPTVTAQLGEAVSQAPAHAESFRAQAQG